jgi:hypothetical protein
MRCRNRPTPVVHATSTTPQCTRLARVAFGCAASGPAAARGALWARASGFSDTAAPPSCLHTSEERQRRGALPHTKLARTAAAVVRPVGCGKRCAAVGRRRRRAVSSSAECYCAARRVLGDHGKEYCCGLTSARHEWTRESEARSMSYQSEKEN